MISTMSIVEMRLWGYSLHPFVSGCGLLPSLFTSVYGPGLCPDLPKELPMMQIGQAVWAVEAAVGI